MKLFIVLVMLNIGAVAALLINELHTSSDFARRIEEYERNGPKVITPSGEDYGNVQDDIKAIRAIYNKSLQAWCQADGKAYGAVFSQDAHYISFDGSQTEGRQSIAQSHQELFDKYLKGSCLVGQISEIRFTSPITAILIVYGGTVFDNGSLRRPSIQTYAAKKDGDAWQFTNFQNTRILNMTLLHYLAMGIKLYIFKM